MGLVAVEGLVTEWQGGGAGATLVSCCPTVGPGACAVALFWSELELDAIKGSELWSSEKC